MARRPVTDLSTWPSLSLEGNLIAPAMLTRIDERTAPEQDAEDYGVRKGLTLREDISTAFRVGQSHFDTFSNLENPSANATQRFIKALLKEAFGFSDIEEGQGFVALFAGADRIPIIVVPPTEERLDRRSETLSVDRSRSPAFALQDYLNEEEDALWGLATNGTVIRLMRDNASLTRPAHIEANLAQIFTNEDAASFGLLWLLIHRTRFGNKGAPATDCSLERWRDTGTKEGEVARDRLADQVKQALNILGSGFLEANPELAARLQSGDVNLTDWFNELLRLVYRLIFLMVAEDRNLLHPKISRAEARKLYKDGYSLSHLRAQCFRAATWDRHHDRFEGIKIVFRSLTGGQDLLALPALGGLFAHNMLPSLEGARLRNRSFMEALYRLSWLPGKAGMSPVNWRAMETEELGSVYESLLELQPQLGDDGKSLVFASDAAEQKGNQRKTTGSYYTPDSLVQALLDTALDPVLDKTEAEADDPETALLNLSVIDPACGSGHFLLAAARRIATRLARIRADGTPAEEDFRHALRDVARSCIHGVDRNPMAVELTKVALWIETVDPGLPLGFFDAQIRCGDALLGVFDIAALEQGIPDAAYKALTGDDKATAKHYRDKNKREVKDKDRISQGFGFNRQNDFMKAFAKVRAMPEESVRQIEAKAEALRKLTASGSAVWQLQQACDLYVAAFLLPKTVDEKFLGAKGLPSIGRETIPTSRPLWDYLNGITPFGPMIAGSVDAARGARAFHWPLEFPDIMQRGGFDVVLGNPPWEVIQFSDDEFFSIRSPDIAKLSGAKRKGAISDLEVANPTLWKDFLSELRRVEATKDFVKGSNRFPLTAHRKLNLYSLFAELAANATSERGRSGVIVQSGIATDDGNKRFFEFLTENQRLVSLYDFENREGIFPIHRSMKFSLLTMGRELSEADFVFFATNPNQLEESERRFQLSDEDINLINPNTKTCPVFRSRTDATLTKKIYRNSGAFVHKAGTKESNWDAQLSRILNLTDDSHLFFTQDVLVDLPAVLNGNVWHTEEGEKFLPLYEPKMIHHYDHRWATYDPSTDSFSDVNADNHRDSGFSAQPRWWVEQSHIKDWLEARNWRFAWLLGWRDTTNATNERTTIATIFPMCAVGNNLPQVILGEKHSATDYALLVANFSALPFDYAARQKVGGTHLNYFILEQLPVLKPTSYNEAQREFIVKRVIELTYTSHDLKYFADDLGYNGAPFPWEEDRRAYLLAELDAFYAQAYNLDRDELRYVLDPADVKGENYPSETFRILKEKEIKQYGEYRTQRLVLEAWDRMEADGTFVELGLNDEIATPTMQPIQLPPFKQLPDAVWARAAPSPQHDPSAALAAILKSLDSPTSVRTVRLTAALMLEPHLLTPLLQDEDQAQWLRLVGQEAEPHSGNVVGFAARTTPGWNTAITNHRGNGRLIEDLSTGTWAPGVGLDSFDTAGWPEGRASFVLSMLRNLDIDRTIEAAPDEVGNWIADVATG